MSIAYSLEQLYTCLDNVEKKHGKFTPEMKAVFFAAYSCGYADGQANKTNNEGELKQCAED